MPKKVIPYSKQFIDKSDINFVSRSLQQELITQGKSLEKLEITICKMLKCKYAIACSSATAGLHIINMLFNKKKVAVPALTFFSTISTIIQTQNYPKLYDVDDSSLLLDVNKLKKEKKNIDVVINVLFAGNAINSQKLRKEFSKKIIIEDASHALGSNYSDGVPVGSCKYSDFTVFSLHPVKSITCGEGGIITTNNKKYYEKLKLLRNHGILRSANRKHTWQYEINNLGLNYRLSDIHASLALSQLKKLKKFINYRKTVSKKYDTLFKKNNNISLPQNSNLERKNSASHLYIIRLKNYKIRNLLFEKLKSYGIGSQVHYIPAYKFSVFKNKNYEKKLKNTENHFKTCLSIPCFFKLDEKKIYYIAKTINSLTSK
ncbi:DegT/DnrJ/EryC1/StrS family aminotransferase [Candidatus Pelagibacter ubique]|nr:DegT/DnrJ/EryC1/StrS family aminotransferase [Candidatus Pelagibacter ubique]